MKFPIRPASLFAFRIPAFRVQVPLIINCQGLVAADVTNLRDPQDL